MKLMEPIIFAIFILFGCAAYQDFRKREVEDYLSISIWLFSIFAFPLQAFILFFVGGWAVASVMDKIKKPLAAWGDVLFFPVFASLMGTQWLIGSLLALLAAQVYLWYRLEYSKELKENVKGSAFVLVMFLLAFAYSVISIFA